MSTATAEKQTPWYKEAIIYQLHVRSFRDSNGDGIGDFPGLTEKLDYFQSLGVTCLWLLPFFPSPLKDDGYDISNYCDVNPIYGTLKDFREFLKETHRRGMRVLVELVMNHTSDQHVWFQKARRAKPGSKQREFYVWSEDARKYKDARIIFKDFEHSNWTWDEEAKAYYWHRFYSHQPDLNYDNPAVMKAMFGVLDFWLAMGVDGFRLDAIPYLVERDDTNCENLPETHVLLKELRARVDRKYKDKLILAEANQWPEDAVAYFGKGDECHMAFHFPLMPRMFMALRMEDHYPILDILKQTPMIPENCQWALFLRNHDELTLEMVTDEERDYMYRSYAFDRQARINLGIRRRLAPLLGNNRRKIELMNSLLFSLPGTPIVYYGDEIGMGDNIYLGDRNGVRTPMQWNADRNAGFSSANPQKLFLPVVIDPEYHYQSVNVEAHHNNPDSLYWWMNRMISLRKNYPALTHGDFEALEVDNRRVLAFVRCSKDQKMLVVANLSRSVEYVRLDLKAYRDLVPVEVLAEREFPAIGESAYFLTLGPYSFYWFALQESSQFSASATSSELPRLSVERPSIEVILKAHVAGLESRLKTYLPHCRWFAGKNKFIKQVVIQDRFAVPFGEGNKAYGLNLRVEYYAEEPEYYLLPVAVATGAVCDPYTKDSPESVVCVLEDASGASVGVLFDAFLEPRFARAFVDIIFQGKTISNGNAKLLGTRTQWCQRIRKQLSTDNLDVQVLRSEQSNTTVLFGREFVLKFIRRFETEVSPEVEMCELLSLRKQFPHTAPYAGNIRQLNRRGEQATVAVLHGFVPNEGSAWSQAEAAASQFQQAVRSLPSALPLLEDRRSVFELVKAGHADWVPEYIGPFYLSATLLGQRTAEMHEALASEPGDPAFAPEPFSDIYRRSLYQSMRNHTARVLNRLEPMARGGEHPAHALIEQVLGWEEEIYKKFADLLRVRISGTRIRVHGDLHLAQVLNTGKDYVIIDFEGEPTRPVSERKLKFSPLKDVAGMIRSFQYAAHHELVAGPLRFQKTAIDESWGDLWFRHVSAAFLRGYLQVLGNSPLLPREDESFSVLLDTYLLEKALYEVTYEIQMRPEWVAIPLRGLTELIRPGSEEKSPPPVSSDQSKENPHEAADTSH